MWLLHKRHSVSQKAILYHVLKYVLKWKCFHMFAWRDLLFSSNVQKMIWWVKCVILHILYIPQSCELILFPYVLFNRIHKSEVDWNGRLNACHIIWALLCVKQRYFFTIWNFNLANLQNWKKKFWFLSLKVLCPFCRPKFWSSKRTKILKTALEVKRLEIGF